MTSAPTDNLLRMWTEPLELRAGAEGDGNTMFGHFAVFNRWTEIDSWFEGRFRERIAPTAFDQTFAERGDKIRVLYDHGHDPSVGNKPLGVPTTLKADKRGAYYEVDLFDATYVNDLKPAMRAGQLGASFRFKVTSEEWNDPKSATKDNPQKLPERTITGLDLYEFGPVTFPAYAEASAGLRSMTDDWCERMMSDPLFVARFAERNSARAAEHILSGLVARGPRPDDPEVAPRGQAEDHKAGADPRVLALQIEALRLKNPKGRAS